MPKARRAPVSTDRRFKKKAGNSDYGTPERWQHSGRTLELTERAGVLAARATEEHIVDIMVTQRILDKTQSEAAFKFKLDYQRAGLAAHVTSSYSPLRGAEDFFHGRRARNDFEEAAYRRWRHAVRELGIRLSGVVISVICHDVLPLPHDIAFLQCGLDKLVKWYGLPVKKSG